MYERLYDELSELYCFKKNAILNRSAYSLEMKTSLWEPAHVKRAFIVSANSERSGESMHRDTLARAFAIRTHNVLNRRKLQKQSRTSAPY